MKCPKCKTINAQGSKECDGCGVIFADIKSGAVQVNLECPWNDHGAICGNRGSISDSLNGAGPWYCSKHYWKLKGYVVSDVKQQSYRERWYESRGLDYEPPKRGNTERMREPGED